MRWGYHYCLATVSIMGLSVSFSLHSFALLLSFLSVNALLTLLMPYVSGLVLLNRSLFLTHTHTPNGRCECTSALMNCFIKALIHTVAPLFWFFFLLFCLATDCSKLK